MEAAKIQVNGAYTAVLGVNPSSFRGYAAHSTAASDQLWQSVADGGVAVSYTMGSLDHLSLGGTVTVNGRQRENGCRSAAFGTVGIDGVDAVVSHTVARSLGMPAAERHRDQRAARQPGVARGPNQGRAPARRVGRAAHDAGQRPGGPTPVGAIPGISAVGGAMSAAQLTAALNAALSRRGLPYVWGAAGPSSFDCSGLVEWSFAQAGVRMPRVAADQARTGPSVPVSQLQPGDLLFYHTDPTDPGYISHVAIYLGNGKMIQAPQPGQNVEVVPAGTGTEFAGAVRVDPRTASTQAARLA